MKLIDFSRSLVVDAPAVPFNLPCQVVRIRSAMTRSGKPYLDVEVTDGAGSERFKVWEDTPAYPLFNDVKEGDPIHLSAAFSKNSYGLNLDNIQFHWLDKEEVQKLFAPSPEREALLAKDWNDVVTRLSKLTDPRLRILCHTFLAEHGEKFRRAAAARDYHHARRGGLLEHTAQMLRAGVALSEVYTTLNWDLVLTGILFHDCGKLWELDYQPRGFECPLTTIGELLGHITVGIEVVNRIWRTIDHLPEFLQPGSPGKDQVREHLLHLIASHHGLKEYGAPVTPRTPEAWMLHHIDNIDAYQEMIQQTYREKGQLAPGIYEPKRPLEGRAVAPLTRWEASETGQRHGTDSQNRASKDGGLNDFSGPHMEEEPIVYPD